jgi:two-component system LytT family response regulator
LRTVIVEDEPLARIHLRDLVLEATALQLVGEATDGSSALAVVTAQQPQLLLLDISLPELSGLDLLDALASRPGELPLVIFVTARQEHAVRAFELGAADYLLKPFTRERFARAIRRVRDLHAAERRREESTTSPTAFRTAPLPHGEPKAPPLVVRERGRVHAIDVASILWLEADDDYVVVHAERGRSLLTLSLTELLSRLKGADFVRVHRSYAVHLSQVTHCEVEESGRWSVHLKGGHRVLASRTGTRALRERLGQRATTGDPRAR